jgi:hypothetical protein
VKELDPAEKLLLKIDAQELITEEAQEAAAIRNEVKRRAILFNCMIEAGFSEEAAMAMLIAELSASYIQIGGYEE